MPTNVIMPQMGESIAEGTLTKWLKKAGDAVKRDEPLFEISTDKVDAEIPAPASGTLLEILVPEGQTVPINTVVARLGEAGEDLDGRSGARRGTGAAAAPPRPRLLRNPKILRTVEIAAPPPRRRRAPAVPPAPAPAAQLLRSSAALSVPSRPSPASRRKSC